MKQNFYNKNSMQQKNQSKKFKNQKLSNQGEQA